MTLTDRHYRLLVESVSDYAMFVIDLDGVVRSWNVGAERIKGYRAEEIIGQHMSRFYAEADREARTWEQLLTAARADGRAEAVGWRVRKDGTPFWASVVVTALHDDDGRLIGYAKVTRDLTDRAYKAFVDAFNGIIWNTDPTGKPSVDSPTWRAFTGQTEAQWLSQQGWAPVHPDDQSHVLEAWTRAKTTGEILNAEFRLRRHDGVYVWMGCRSVPIRDAAGNIREWFGVTFDISARKLAELERERAASWWSTTLRSIGDAVIATDGAGRITFLNPVAEDLTGWSLADGAGRPLADVFRIINEDSREPVEDPVARVLREGITVGLANHTVLVRRDGGERAIEDSAAPIRTTDDAIDGVVLVFHDATREKQETARRAFLARAGEELMQSADYREALSHIAQLAVPRLADWCAVDIVQPGSDRPERLAVAHVDPNKIAFAHQLHAQYPPDPKAETGVPNVIRTGRSELYPDLPAEFLEAVAVDDEHLRIIRALDLRSAMIVPLRDRERTFGALSFVYTGQRRYDADDLAFAEELARRAAIVVERRRLEEDALLASRAKDEFLAMLGHELRNPLAPIRTALQLMALRGDPATAREREVIERQVTHLVTLVDDLLDVSRITRAQVKLERAPIEISVVLARALEMASPLLEHRRHHLTMSVPRTGCVVDADAARLAQVFSNLLTNAAKYTDPGGHISVSAAAARGDVVVTVQDSGVGIAPEVLPTIFEMFVQEPQTIARSQGGLGLGLSIVRSLVKMHGGGVTVASPGRGGGSTFTVTLPAHRGAVASAQPVAPTAAPEADRPPARRRLLLVDDNKDAVELLEQLLQGQGYDTRIAFDGPSALAIAGEFRPELALLDIGLPVMDGYELAERLRALLVDRPPRMIALTGYGQEEDVGRAAHAGFDRHLVKPVLLEDLCQALEDVGRPAS